MIFKIAKQLLPNNLIKSKNKIPKYADVMTMEDFKENCKCEMFTDSDGFGYPVIKNKMNRNLIIYPSDVMENNKYKKFTHIAWFNK